MVRSSIFSGMVLLCTVLAGCGEGAFERAPVVTSGQASIVPRGISRAVTPLLAHMQAAYEKSEFSSISGLFTDPRLSLPLQRRMRRWAEEGVNPLRIALVYARQLAPSRLAGTVEFWSDPRATPVYMIFVFQRGKKRLRISGADSGLTGSSLSTVNWAVSSSKHFKVYHSPYQLMGSDRGVFATLESQRTIFESRFGVRVAASIAYYLYPTQGMMARMSHGGCGTTSEYVGCALPYTHPPSIHTIEWPSYHEPIHVFETALEPRAQKSGTYYVAPLFIGEGTAVALEDRQLDPHLSDYCSDLSYVPLDACAQQAASRVKPLTLLSDKGFQHGDLGNSYLIGGSFVKYLILKYGYRTFGQFFYALAAQPRDSEHDYDVAALRVFHHPIRTLLSQWAGELCHSGC